MTRILRITQPQAGDTAGAQRQFVSGSQEVIAQVISDYHLAVRGYLLHLLRDATVADDLAQDVFV